MTYIEFITSVQLKLKELYGVQEGRAIAVRLLMHFCSMSVYGHIIEPDKKIGDKDLSLLQSAVDELSKARPLQYVLGKTEFAGREFMVREGVLIPRPETEELVKWILEDEKNKNGVELNILDAACGSGCIGITLGCELPGSRVFMCDISPEALEISAENSNGLIDSAREPATTIFTYDLLDDTTIITDHIPAGSLGLLVSNPPYIRESEKSLMRQNVLDYEPSLALFVPDDDPLVFYSALAKLGKNLLCDQGMLYLEINEAFGEETVKLLSKSGYSDIILRKDIYDKDRMIRATFSR